MVQDFPYSLVKNASDHSTGARVSWGWRKLAILVGFRSFERHFAVTDRTQRSGVAFTVRLNVESLPPFLKTSRASSFTETGAEFAFAN